MTELGEGEGSQVVVEQLVSAPTSEAVCVAFTHRRDLLLTDASPESATTSPQNATLPDLQVGVTGATRVTALLYHCYLDDDHPISYLSSYLNLSGPCFLPTFLSI